MPPRIDFNLYLITDRHQTNGRNLTEVVEEALLGGVKAIQLREKELTSKELYEMAYELRKLTARHNAKLIINDRIDIALAVDADGVHIGTNSIPIHRARKVIGDRKLIGVSCHNQVSAVIAQEKGADFITFGPVYYTPSKSRYGEPVGIEKLQQATDTLSIPVFALGGITLKKVGEVIEHGAFGIGLISAILTAQDPRHEAHCLIDLLPPLVTP